MRWFSMFVDRFFTKSGDGVLKNRRIVFLPAIIILCGLLTVKFAVGPISKVLAAGIDVATTQEEEPVTINVLANDTDSGGESLKIEEISQGVRGKVVLNEDGTVTYTPNANFCGVDVFSYKVVNSKGQSATTRVEVTVSPVNDAPMIVSKPVTDVAIGAEYFYDVNAADPDPGDRLTYTLENGPEGMSIDQTTGVISWRSDENQIEPVQVKVKVADSSGTNVDTQSFEITVGQIGASRMAVLKAERTVGHSDIIDLLAPSNASKINKSDDDRWETGPMSDCCYEFSDVSIPRWGRITSVEIFIEHFEDSDFTPDRLIWLIGTDLTDHPDVWVSMKAPIRKTARWEGVDSWDVTSYVDTAEKVNALQFQIKNRCVGQSKAAFVDYVYVVVKWEQG